MGDGRWAKVRGVRVEALRRGESREDRTPCKLCKGFRVGSGRPQPKAKDIKILWLITGSLSLLVGSDSDSECRGSTRVCEGGLGPEEACDFVTDDRASHIDGVKMRLLIHRLPIFFLFLFPSSVWSLGDTASSPMRHAPWVMAAHDARWRLAARSLAARGSVSASDPTSLHSVGHFLLLHATPLLYIPLHSSTLHSLPLAFRGPSRGFEPNHEMT